MPKLQDIRGANLGRKVSRMRTPILSELTEGPGYLLGSLTGSELEWVRARVRAQYLERLGKLQPELLKSARRSGIENYHTLPIRFDHGSAWPTESRLLSSQY